MVIHNVSHKSVRNIEPIHVVNVSPDVSLNKRLILGSETLHISATL